jgi:hypothetical protein
MNWLVIEDMIWLALLAFLIWFPVWQLMRVIIHDVRSAQNVNDYGADNTPRGLTERDGANHE